MDSGRIELPPQTQCPNKSGGPSPDRYRDASATYPHTNLKFFFMDLARIELASQQCECRVLPLYDKPRIWCGGKNAI